jgi:H+-translocating NAD(P) transhydrogenase subunit alpha|eukprot:COSAG06_NODE_5138_length_3687_cov_4.373467_1_plen_83_part_00
MYTTWSKRCEIMILTAAIPGMPPPRLVSKAMVDNMEPGSVIVDIAANKSWGLKYLLRGIYIYMHASEIQTGWSPRSERSFER